ncbi:uncharacterized protein DNG_03099 [Cephalotrichum gorgonifer]|uniref:RRM domain-containing protein n=1 Tax=Cephalotrichum gorgonifer TaxID=2041049 RepID=A0AAE8MV81_9PEZI|nr:uncharacterized protein DNG_03099 [Cephalotrichum gorgonifer]
MHEQIVVERLTKNITEAHLYEIFGQFGHIRDLDLPMNRQFNTNRGTAYILFSHEPDAETAIAHMHEAQIDGATVNVSIVLPRRKMSPPPPSPAAAPTSTPSTPRPPAAAPPMVGPGLAAPLAAAGVGEVVDATGPDQTLGGPGRCHGLSRGLPAPGLALEAELAAGVVGAEGGRLHIRDPRLGPDRRAGTGRGG